MRTTFLTCVIASSLVLVLNVNAEEISNSLGMKLVHIPPGKFLMGSPESEPGREAQEVQHEVELSKGFYLGAHEVTVGQFKQFVADRKYQTDGERDGKGAYGINEAGKIEELHAKFTWKSPGFVQTDDHPVVDVSWSDAKAFCKWLSEKEKKTYRLPTEAEWEYACRAGTKTSYVHGDDSEGLAEIGNGADATARAKYPGWSIGIQAKDGHAFTAPVGQFNANAFGLFDMHGNVWEWCEDWYVPNSYPKEKQVNPTGSATGKAKVQRGGGWSSDAKRMRSAARVGRDHSAYRGCYLGFRVALVQASAETPKESGAVAEKPASGRVAYMLLVNGAVTDAVVKSANIEGHKSVDAPYVGTWHSFVQGMDQIQKGRLDPVERGDIDVMLIGTLMSYPNAEAWKNHLGPDDSTLAGLAALGAKNNPKFRICWQTYIWPVGETPKDGKKTLDVAATKKRAASEPLKELEKLVDGINEKQGRKVVLISPVGEATIKLVEMVDDGKFPGITDPADLWTEFNMHSNRHVLALTAYCNVATMYGVSPVGLKPDFSKVTYGGGGKGPGIQSMEGITDEQRTILQNIAWETVSKYRHAGIAVAEYPESQPAKKPPAGLRVMSGGHSWSTENSAPLCQAAGITGDVKLNKQGLNSGRIEDLTPLLEKGEIDVYVWQHNSVGPEFPKFLPTLVELGPRHNPNFRVLMQMPWLTHDGRKDVMSPEEYEKTDLAEYQTKMEAYRKQQEAYVDEVNAKAGKRVVFLVPLGDGMLEVRKMIVAGKFPGVTNQRNSVLAGDIMPHQGLLGLRLGTYMHFAALYRMSPEGLKFPGKEGDGLTDEQRPILQKLAWDMVSKYPYAGIAKLEASEPSKDAANPRIAQATDPSLKREFEYLIFDLGQGVELKLVKIEAKGKTFTIGSTKEEQEKVTRDYFEGRRPEQFDFEEAASVTLTDDYYIGQCEVYRAQFRRFVEDTKYVTDAELLEGGYGYNEETMKFEGRDRKYTWQNTGVSSAGEMHPVTNVSRNDARKFCEWLLKKCDGKIKLREVRVPGEAEWEYACRAGSTARFSSGDDDERLAEFANVADATWREKLSGPNAKALKASDGHAFAAPVGQFKPNHFGVYDMHGNAWEWCDDFYGKYSALPKENNARQTKSQGETRPVLRGGAWHLSPGASRCTNRFLVGAGPSRYGAAGFRVVAVP